MKKRFFLILALFTPLLLLAQETEVELPKDFNAVLDFFLPVIIGQIVVLLTDAKKYMGSGIWDWGVFFKSKVTPFLLTTAASVVVYFLIVYVPFSQPFVEVITGPLGVITAAGLFGALQSVIDGLLKPTVDPSTPEAVNMRYDQPVVHTRKTF